MQVSTYQPHANRPRSTLTLRAAQKPKQPCACDHNNQDEQPDPTETNRRSVLLSAGALAGLGIGAFAGFSNHPLGIAAGAVAGGMVGSAIGQASGNVADTVLGKDRHYSTRFGTGGALVGASVAGMLGVTHDGLATAVVLGGLSAAAGLYLVHRAHQVAELRHARNLHYGI